MTKKIWSTPKNSPKTAPKWPKMRNSLKMGQKMVFWPKLPTKNFDFFGKPSIYIKSWRNNRIQISYLHFGLRSLWGRCVLHGRPSRPANWPHMQLHPPWSTYTCQQHFPTKHGKDAHKTKEGHIKKKPAGEGEDSGKAENPKKKAIKWTELQNVTYMADISM